MQAACDSLARSSSTCSRAKAFSSSGAEVSTKSCPCALRCTAHPLVDVSHAYLRPRVQEGVSETSWQVFFHFVEIQVAGDRLESKSDYKLSRRRGRNSFLSLVLRRQIFIFYDLTSPGGRNMRTRGRQCLEFTGMRELGESKWQPERIKSGTP